MPVEVLWLDLILKLFYAVITLVMFWAVLRFRDKLIGINFKAEFERVKNDSLSFAVYFGLTAIAVAIIISGFF